MMKRTGRYRPPGRPMPPTPELPPGQPCTPACDQSMQALSPDMRDFVTLLLKHDIDLLTSMSSENADGVFADLQEVAVWGLQIPVVSRRALLRAKRESLRPKDRIDAEELELELATTLRR